MSVSQITRRNGKKSQLYRAAVLASAPLHYWRLKEVTPVAFAAVTDEMGTDPGSYQGTQTDISNGGAGGPIATPSDPTGRAKRYGALASHVQLGNPTALQCNGASDWTLEWFMRLYTRGTDFPGYVRKGLSSNLGNFIIYGYTPVGAPTWHLSYKRTGTYEFPIIDGIPSKTVLADGALALWHHYAITYDATADIMRGFLDGVQKLTNNTPLSNNADVATPVQFGRSDNFTGNVDLQEIAYYNRALPAAELLSHYQSVK